MDLFFAHSGLWLHPQRVRDHFRALVEFFICEGLRDLSPQNITDGAVVQRILDPR